jgi:predicted nucleic acid-binding Zn ribbon protein
MPLYDYQCRECGGVNTALILNPREAESQRKFTIDY